MKLIITLFAIAAVGCTVCTALERKGEVVSSDAAPSASVQLLDAEICAGGSELEVFATEPEDEGDEDGDRWR